MNFYGVWGTRDGLIETRYGGDPEHPDRTVDPFFDTYFTAADYVTDEWAKGMNCGARRTRPTKYNNIYDRCW